MVRHFPSVPADVRKEKVADIFVRLAADLAGPSCPLKVFKAREQDTRTTMATVEGALLIVVYYLAEFVNKSAFVLACWSDAKSETEGNNAAISF